MFQRPTQRLEELAREIERQDQQWAQVEAELRALSELGVAVSRRVVDDLDEAFTASAPSRPAFYLTPFLV